MKGRPYIVVDRPGYYGYMGRVWSSHASVAAARRAAAQHTYVDETGKTRSTAIVAVNDGGRYKKGDTFYGDMPPAEA